MTYEQAYTPKSTKYIVDGFVPQDGQVAGPGGIRENGKLASLYKNPIPLESILCEQQDNQNLIETEETSNLCGEESFGETILSFLGEIVVEGILKPLVPVISDFLCSKIDDFFSRKEKCKTQEPTVEIGLEPIERPIEELEYEEKDNIIYFPGRYVS